MQSAKQIKELLASHGATPKRSLGQNFLIDPALVARLADAAGITGQQQPEQQQTTPQIVLEVGPGTGTLTDLLLARNAVVIACELDDTLAAILADRYANQVQQNRFILVHGDCLANKRQLNQTAEDAINQAMREHNAQTFALVANLPYGSATPLLSTLLIDHPKCDTIAITVQKEVADRILAQPNSRDYGPISVIAAALCNTKRIATLPPGCFWPPPKVSSAMALLQRRTNPITQNPARLSSILTTLFTNRRKQLRAALPPNLAQGLPEAGVLPTMRAEQLTPAQFEALAQAWPANNQHDSIDTAPDRR